jgi:hypothetical protein
MSTENTASVKLNLTQLNEVYVGTFGGKRFAFNWTEIPTEVIGRILTEGALRVLRDGTGGKDKTEAEKLAAVTKRVDSWRAGSWTVSARGSAIETIMRELIKANVERLLGFESGRMPESHWLAFQTERAKAAGVVVEKGKVIPLDAVLKGNAIMAVNADVAAMDPAPNADTIATMVAETMAQREADLRAMAETEQASRNAAAAVKVDTSAIVF